MPTVIPDHLTTREDRLKNLKTIGKNTYEEHILKEAATNRWHLRRPDTSHYWTEIVILRGRRVLTHGDGGATIFSGGCDFGSKRELLRWVARMDNDPRYAREKSSREMGYMSSVMYDEAIAKSDVFDWIQYYKEDLICDPRDAEYYENTLKGLYDVYRRLMHRGYMHEHELHRDMYEATKDSDISSIGYCIKPRVVYAIYAVKKLLNLLDEIEEG